ncbi:unnamed protein product [Allacma fusca]|uniref:Proton-coupled folate transporter n=1 Tax=Allacma fusca TaxID=39272 RepID=A0A8J2L580_9HEXA|nr:unnamed protein product [Allacma fusca]
MKKMTQRQQAGFCRLLSEITVEPVLFLYMLSTFSQYALFQDLVYSKVCWAKYNASVCDNLHNDSYHEELNDVQTDSSHWILMSTISLVIPSLLIAIYLGSWSDRFGRKWPVVIPPLGGVLSCLVYIFISFKSDAPVAWILFASAVSGFSGGFVSCIMSCMTYVASVSSEENRTVRISRLEAMTFLGGTIGPFISGSMLEITGHGYAFFFMMICYALACLYAVFVVRDVFEGGLGIEEPRGVVVVVREGVGRGREGFVKSREGFVRDEEEYVKEREEFEKKGEGSLRQGEVFGIERDEGGLVKQREELLRQSNPAGALLFKNVPSESLSSRDAGLSAIGINDDGESRRVNRPSVWSGSSNESGSSACSHGSGAPSTHEDDERRKIILAPETSLGTTCCSRYFGSQHFLDVLSTAFRRREENRRLYLMLVVFAAFLAMMVTAGELDVAYLFAKDQPLLWSYQTYSYYFGFKYGLGAFMLLIGMPIFLRLGISDTTICLIGLVSRMAGLILYGLSNTTLMAFFVPLVATFSFFTIPATRALLSKIVAPSEHGKMFSFVAIMEDLCTLSASLVFNSVYPITRQVGLYRGSIFFMAAGLLVIPLILIWFVRQHLILTSYNISPSPTSMDSNERSTPELPQQAKPDPESSPLIPSLEIHKTEVAERGGTEP